MSRLHDSYNAYIEKVRHTEYPQLSSTTYLDHAGTTVYARSLIDTYHQDLTNNLYGNPHSYSPASDLSTRKVDEVRLAVLNYFQASPDDFDVVFTANATAAIKLVADCFREQEFDYIYHKDVHTSVVGVRELSASDSRCLASDEEVERWINLQKSRITSRLQLFAYPAQSNLNGYRPPYSWCRSIRDGCRLSDPAQKTYVLLDAASYLTSGRLDLSCVDDAPDFVALSFYKIFGFPDLGALLVKKTAYDVMTHRRYFGGGTVDTVTVLGGVFHGSKRTHLHDFLEDGTLPFHNILAVGHAITVHERIYGSATDISRHTAHLIAWLHSELKALKHTNSMPVIDIYEDRLAIFGDSSTQGPIIAFNILRSDGSFIGKSHIERLAIDCGFQLRTGGVCNPGGIASMLQLSHWELMRNFTEGVRCGGDIDLVGAKPTGICRVSLGPMSTMSDVARFAKFIQYFFVEKKCQKFVDTTVHDHVLVKDVAPIDGCSGFSVRNQNFDAYSLWNKQWCIINSNTGQAVQSKSALIDLSVRIDVKTEQLHITHSSGDEITLSLWDIPRVQDHTKWKPDSTAFDLYEHKDINDWLSTYLGVQCSLGRYRHETLSQTKEATTCVVSTCSAQFTSKEELNEHYPMHAKVFMERHPFTASQQPKTFDRLREKLQGRRSDKTPRPDVSSTQMAKSNRATLSLPRHSVHNSIRQDMPPYASVDAIEFSPATPRTSRSSTTDMRQNVQAEHSAKKDMTKNHTFAVIVTKIKRK